MKASAGTWFLPVSLLACGLALGGAAGVHRQARNEVEIAQRFDGLAGRALEQVNRRVQLYEYGLRGTRGALIGAGPAMDHERFRSYADSRDLTREFPGSRGYGFVRLVPRAAEARFVEANRRDGRPDFAVRSFGAHDGDRYVIQYVEPEGPNAAAVGLDLASEPRRRAAAQQSRETGQATLTAPIQLVQIGDGHELGFLMMLPVDVPGATGWTYAPLAVDRVFADIDTYDDTFEMMLADGTSPAFYRTPGAGVDGLSWLVRHETLPVYGRTWDVTIRARPAFVQSLHLTDPLQLGAGISGLALLLAVVLHLYLRTLDRRLQADRRFRDLAESIPHLVWTCGDDGACDYLSPQWFDYTGSVPVEDARGYFWGEHVHPDDLGPLGARWAESTALGAALDFEFRICRHDGEYRWFETRAHPVRDASGRVVKWFGTSTDIQDLRDAREMMRLLNRELELRVGVRTEQLHAVAEQLRHAQRISHVGSWELDTASRALSWSEEMFRIAGRAPGSQPPAYDDQAALLAPASWQALTDAIQHGLRTGDGFQLDLEVVRADGERRATVARAEIDRDAHGRAVRVTGTIQDVTELVAARSELVKLSERLQLATSAARTGIWDWSVPDDVLVWDDTTHRIYDLPPERFSRTLGGWHAAVHPDDRDGVEVALAGAVARGDTFSAEFRIVCADETVRHLRTTASVHRDPVTGAALRLVGANWDVTEQHHVDLALRSSEAVLRGILTHAGSAIIGTDCDGTITHFNPAAELLLDYTAWDLVGVGSAALFHDPDEVTARRDELVAELGIPIAVGFEVLVAKARLGRAEAREWTCLRRDGTRVPVWLTVSAVRDDRGEVFGFLGVAVDLTARKAQEDRLVTLNGLLAERSEQAESANQAKSEFLANMSHEIRTPMNAITGVTHLLSQSALDADQRRLLGIVQRASRTLLGMINDVLDLSKIEAGQLTLDVAPFSLVRLLDDLGQVMTAYSAGKDLDLIVDADAGQGLYLLGDSVRLTQSLTNLVSNAIRFTDRGTVRLAVGSRELGPERVELRFDVSDSGVGMDAPMLARLFTPFTQATGTARRVGGTGLGLTIVKRLVLLMGGEVGVESTVGVGSRFWCTIPFVLADEVRATGLGADRRAGGRLVGARLLVVDDSDVNREVARRILELEGARVDTAASGPEAIERVRIGGYDAVLMDIQMEDMDGVEATQRIRALPELPRMPILAVTAWALASERERAVAAGVDDFVSKPFEPVGLVLRIREHVERHRGAALAAGTASFAPPRQQSATRAWPVLDGVDVREASARFGDDQALYRTLLARLLGEFEALDLDDTSLVLRAHKLRGSAGNLGARRVEQAARALEEAARSYDLLAVERALREVHVELGRVDRAARAWAHGETPEPRDLVHSDATWADIERLLASNDLGVIDLLPRMKSQLAERLAPAPLEAFGRAIDALDFGAALRCFRSHG